MEHLHIARLLIVFFLLFSPLATSNNHVDETSSAPLEAAKSPMGPRAIIETTLAQIKPYIKPDNKTNLVQAIERHVSPYLDFTGMSRLVLGPYWKRADLDQRDRFLECFSRQLTSTQAQTLLDNNHANWQFTEETFNKTKSKAAISFRLSGSLLERTLTLRLKKEQNQWRIYDAAVNSISLLKTFRDNYAVKIESQGLNKTLVELCQTYPTNTRTVTLAGHNWEPFIGRALPGHGLSVEIVSRVFKAAGYEVAMEYTPWQNVLKGMKSGKYDISIANWKTKTRQNLLLFSEPYFHNQLIAISPHKEINTLSELESFLAPAESKLGLMDDYAYGSLLPKTSNVARHKHYSPMLRKLAGGQLDAVLMDMCVANYQMTQHPNLRSKLMLGQAPLEKKSLHITVLKNHPAANTIIQDFNQSLAIFLKSDEYTALLKRYRVTHELTEK